MARLTASALRAGPESPARSLLRSLLPLPLLLLMLSGILGFIATGLIGTSPPDRFDRLLRQVELPLGDLKAVASDPQGRLYTYAAAYGRVQLYSIQAQGPARFVAGWQTPHFKGRPELRIDSEGALQLFIKDRHWRLQPATGFAPGGGTPASYPDSSGQVEIEAPLLLARVVSAPDRRVLLQSRWQVFGLLAGPLIAWLGVLVAALLMALLNRCLPHPARPAGP